MERNKNSQSIACCQTMFEEPMTSSLGISITDFNDSFNVCKSAPNVFYTSPDIPPADNRRIGETVHKTVSPA